MIVTCMFLMIPLHRDPFTPKTFVFLKVCHLQSPFQYLPRCFWLAFRCSRLMSHQSKCFALRKSGLLLDFTSFGYCVFKLSTQISRHLCGLLRLKIHLPVLLNHQKKYQLVGFIFIHSVIAPKLRDLSKSYLATHYLNHRSCHQDLRCYI